MISSTLLKSGLFALATGLITTTASAQLSTTLTALPQGWYDSQGSMDLSISNVLVGNVQGVGFHNFFVFDRSALQFVEIKKATFEIQIPEFLDAPSYFSTNPSDTGALFSLYNYAGSIFDLTNGTDPVAAYADLGSGQVYGSRVVSSADNVPGLLVTVDLTGFFLEYVNGLSGQFALGGALSDLDAASVDDYEYLFAGSENGPSAVLRLEYVPVPEPSTYGLMGAGALGLLVVWRRRAAVKASR